MFIFIDVNSSMLRISWNLSNCAPTFLRGEPVHQTWRRKGTENNDNWNLGTTFLKCSFHRRTFLSKNITSRRFRTPTNLWKSLVESYKKVEKASPGWCITVKFTCGQVDKSREEIVSFSIERIIGRKKSGERDTRLNNLLTMVVAKKIGVCESLGRVCRICLGCKYAVIHEGVFLLQHV